MNTLHASEPPNIEQEQGKMDAMTWLLDLHGYTIFDAVQHRAELFSQSLKSRYPELAKFEIAIHNKDRARAFLLFYTRVSARRRNSHPVLSPTPKATFYRTNILCKVRQPPTILHVPSISNLATPVAKRSSPAPLGGKTSTGFPALGRQR